MILEDGSVFEGVSFGFPASVAGEVIFNTGMVGYPESFTDPSYTGQILTLTYPHIGNYGMPQNNSDELKYPHYESQNAGITALVVADYSRSYHHWNAATSLAQWLYNNRIPAISGVDTRSLTQHLRVHGSLPGKIVIEKNDTDFYDPNSENLVAKVSSSAPQLYGKGERRIVLVDCGCKFNIIRELLQREVEVLRVPWNYPLSDEKCAGILVSNGPGDPKTVTETVTQVQKALEHDVPLFGICLGHQLLSLAIGADTHKMKFGHHSQNQPVTELQSKRAFITSQNHGFAVDGARLPAGWHVSFKNLNDDSCEGLEHKSGRFFSVQFHPEAAPGPTDTSFLFDRFLQVVR